MMPVPPVENEIKNHFLKYKLFVRKADKLVVMVKGFYYREENGILTFYCSLQTPDRSIYQVEAPVFFKEYSTIASVALM